MFAEDWYILSYIVPAPEHTMPCNLESGGRIHVDPSRLIGDFMLHWCRDKMSIHAFILEMEALVVSEWFTIQYSSSHVYFCGENDMLEAADQYETKAVCIISYKHKHTLTHTSDCTPDYPLAVVKTETCSLFFRHRSTYDFWLWSGICLQHIHVFWTDLKATISVWDIYAIFSNRQHSHYFIKWFNMVIIHFANFSRSYFYSPCFIFCLSDSLPSPIPCLSNHFHFLPLNSFH